MIYGLYLSAQGADAQQTRLDVIANNLANASTTGFKRDHAVIQEHPPFDVLYGTGADVPPDQLNHAGGVSVSGTYTNHATGPMVQTKQRLDVALQGDGFFRVQADGQVGLTRDGQFSRNEQGELVTAAHGWPVLGQGGARILLPPDARDIDISPDGTVWTVDETQQRGSVGKLDLVIPQSTELLQKVGNNLYVGGGQLAPAGPNLQVKQGYLEGSGTNPVSEMMELIQASREFETNVNMLKLQDDAMGRLLQAVPLRA